MLALLIGPFATSTNAEPTRVHRYAIAIDDELSIIRVRACFAGKAPRQLMA
jgi:hypothetical protein